MCLIIQNVLLSEIKQPSQIHFYQAKETSSHFCFNLKLKPNKLKRNI